jgi:hypothetical protein
MSRLVGSHEFFSQGILVAMGTGPGRIFLDMSNKTSLEHSELCVFLTWIQNSCYFSIVTHQNYSCIALKLGHAVA